MQQKLLSVSEHLISPPRVDASLTMQDDSHPAINCRAVKSPDGPCERKIDPGQKEQCVVVVVKECTALKHHFK